MVSNTQLATWNCKVPVNSSTSIHLLNMTCSFAYWVMISLDNVASLSGDSSNNRFKVNFRIQGFHWFKCTNADSWEWSQTECTLLGARAVLPRGSFYCQNSIIGICKPRRELYHPLDLARSPHSATILRWSYFLCNEFFSFVSKKIKKY